MRARESHCKAHFPSFAIGSGCFQLFSTLTANAIDTPNVFIHTVHMQAELFYVVILAIYLWISPRFRCNRLVKGRNYTEWKNEIQKDTFDVETHHISIIKKIEMWWIDLHDKDRACNREVMLTDVKYVFFILLIQLQPLKKLLHGHVGLFKYKKYSTYLIW